VQGQPKLISKNAFEPVYSWIIHHDEKWLFTISYIVLAVVLSIWISLFWLVVVVTVHFAFELLRQVHLHGEKRLVILEVFWELKLDFALVLFALALSLYMDFVMGVVGLRSAARLGTVTRAGLRSGSRFLSLERSLRAFLLSVDDLVHLSRVFNRRATTPSTNETCGEPDDYQSNKTTIPTSCWGSWTSMWSKADWFSLILGLLCLIMICMAPWLSEHTWYSVFSTLSAELQPFPGLE
jgi:hypothetical protein